MLAITDVINVLGEAQTAGTIDSSTFVSLLTAFNKAIQEKQLMSARELPLPPSDSRPSASEPIVTYAPPAEVERPHGPPERRAKGVGIEVLAYPPDESGQEPPMATFREEELNR